MKKAAFDKITARVVTFIGLIVLFVAAANGQSGNIGINGKIKTKKTVSGVARDFRRCIYPMCGGVKAPINRAQVQRTRKPKTLTGNAGHDWFLKARGKKN